MLILKTGCKECVHAKMCKFEGNAKMMYDKLKQTNFGDGPNDDYDYDSMSEHYNVNIEISCPDFKKDVSVRSPKKSSPIGSHGKIYVG